MKMPSLPELPERHAVMPEIVLPEIHGMGGNTTVLRSADVFAADQLHSYALEYGEPMAKLLSELVEHAEAYGTYKSPAHKAALKRAKDLLGLTDAAVAEATPQTGEKE